MRNLFLGILLGYVHHTGHSRVRTTTVREGTGFTENAFVGFIREEIVGLFFTRCLEPDTVVLALFTVFPADSLAALDGNFLGIE